MYVYAYAKVDRSLTNLVTFMHDLAGDFKHTHTGTIIKLNECCCLLSALPMTTLSPDLLSLQESLITNLLERLEKVEQGY